MPVSDVMTVNGVEAVGLGGNAHERRTEDGPSLRTGDANFDPLVKTPFRAICPPRKGSNRRLEGVDFDKEAFCDGIKFREQGWPLSSGKVEGGHIHFVHPISKRGSGWLVPNLNNTLALMCIRESEWWQEFWESTGDPVAEPAEAGRCNRKATIRRPPDASPYSTRASLSTDCGTRRGQRGAGANVCTLLAKAPHALSEACATGRAAPG